MVVHDRSLARALDLAGATEEILGAYLERNNLKTSFESEKEAFIMVNEKLFNRKVSEKNAATFLNRAKNSVKHFNWSDLNDEVIVLDPKEEAKTMLYRAITNWWRLNQELTSAMEDFWK